MLAAFAAALLWQSWTVLALELEAIRTQAPVTTVWGLHLCLLLGGAAIVACGPWLWRRFGRRHLGAAAALVLAGYGACGLAPQTNRIFYDEHIYMQIGQTIAQNGRAEYANYATAEHGELHVRESWVNKQPNGHPYLISWWFRIFGVSEGAAHRLIRFEVGLAAALLYLGLVVAPLGLPRGTPFLAALALLGTPLVLWWGHTVAVEPATMLATVAAIAATLLHAALRDPRTGEGSITGATLLGASLAAATYFRPESLLVFPVAALLLLAIDRRLLRDRTTWAAVALAVALAMPQLLQHWAVRHEDWGATAGPRFSETFLAANLRSNAGYFVTGKWFPPAASLLGLVGAFWLFRRQRGLGVALGTWLLLSWGIFVFFYAGGYHYGASSRYAVVSAAPVAVFVGLGAAFAWECLRRLPALGALGAVAVLLNWAASLHFVPIVGREACEARADVAWTRQVAPELPPHSLVISTNTGLWCLLGINTAQPASVTETVCNNLQALTEEFTGGIYLHWDYWANVQPEIAAQLRTLVEKTSGTVVHEGQFEIYRFALYRLDRTVAPPPPGGLPPPAVAELPPAPQP